MARHDLTADVLAENLLSGSRRALARTMTLIENESPDITSALSTLFAHTGKAQLIGVTGAPGTGKSTLVNQLALTLRRLGRTVGIIAVDPTSPFSGGAILGDRIRMRDLSGDAGVFIRSMATRGSLGGLARATANMITALDAAGFDVILIETVGAGQSEVDIARYAHTVLVVEAPGLGDDVQAIKAGILEIADILVVNKADDPRAKNTVRALRGMLDLNSSSPLQKTIMHHGQLLEISERHNGAPEKDAKRWEVPIHETDALKGSGIDSLVELADTHYTYLKESGEMTSRLRLRAAAELENLLRESLLNRLLATVDTQHVADLVDDITERKVAPHRAVNLLLDDTTA